MKSWMDNQLDKVYAIVTEVMEAAETGGVNKVLANSLETEFSRLFQNIKLQQQFKQDLWQVSFRNISRTHDFRDLENARDLDDVISQADAVLDKSHTFIGYTIFCNGQVVREI